MLGNSPSIGGSNNPNIRFQNSPGLGSNEAREQAQYIMNDFCRNIGDQLEHGEHFSEIQDQDILEKCMDALDIIQQTIPQNPLLALNEDFRIRLLHEISIAFIVTNRLCTDETYAILPEEVTPKMIAGAAIFWTIFKFEKVYPHKINNTKKNIVVDMFKSLYRGAFKKIRINHNFNTIRRYALHPYYTNTAMLVELEHSMEELVRIFGPLE